MRRKRIIGLVLALTLVMGMGVASFADRGTTQGEKRVPGDDPDYKRTDDSEPYARWGFGGARQARPGDFPATGFILEEDNSVLLMPRSSIVVDGVTWHQIKMDDFKYRGQETAYSCGAACVKMVLRYLVGKDCAEATIRDGCNTTQNGTYLSDMRDYTNSMQDAHSYIGKNGVSKSTMKSDLYRAIVNNQVPPVVGVRESKNNGWPFSLGGHFVTLYSITDDKTLVDVADPWSAYVGDLEHRWYEMDAETLYDSFVEAYCGYMY